MAQIIAQEVSKTVLADLQGVHYKVLAGVVGTLVSAIVYMYLTQKSDEKKAKAERTEALGNIWALIAENGKLMEQVKSDMKSAKESNERLEKSNDRLEKIIEKMKDVLLGCKNRRKGNDEI